MNFIADLHIHSRFSMATSRALTIPHLAGWAMRKGINVLATGDFTHPKWRAELGEQLELDDESGLYRPKPEYAPSQNKDSLPYFCLEAEISSIYKKGGKTRKIHNLVFAPDMETAEKISARLALIGNINSDGRPILGLDSHDLLEIVLECSSRAVLIPAHIWTPWFSLFGSRSGFDSIEECYGDLTPHIFALETGLSSDPPMNRCLSALDGYALISNSDAHSGANLGREANMFYGQPSYDDMFAALEASASRIDQTSLNCRFLGTCEFYPEEGKYHLDGHRACNVVLSPQESRELNNLCPVCDKPLTIGVLHRVMELADREQAPKLPFEPEARMLVPLPEVISQIMGSGVASRKVQARYDEAVSRLGPELDILCSLPVAEVRAFWEPLGEAVARMRSGSVTLEPGFDGQYGIIGIFSREELEELREGKLKKLPGLADSRPAKNTGKVPCPMHITVVAEEAPAKVEEFSPSQKEAVMAGPGPVFVMAGPGAGKTRALVGRIKHLLRSCDAEKILAVTFTRRAAEEMRERLLEALPKGATLPQCDTLHGLAWKLVRQETYVALLNEDEAKNKFFEACGKNEKAAELWKQLEIVREGLLPMPENLAEIYKAYENSKKLSGCVDYTDLLTWLLRKNLRGKWSHALIDEMQDFTPLQLKVMAGLLPPDGSGLFGIGDPDQAIYGFRGACADILAWLRQLWPIAQVLRLGQSYRSSQKILDMAADVLGKDAKTGRLDAIKMIPPVLRLFHASSEKSEAIWIAKNIVSMLGPTSHSLLDNKTRKAELSPADIAVLVRLKSQATTIIPALREHGVPFSAPCGEQYWQDERCATFIARARAEDPDVPPLAFLSALLETGDKTFANIGSNKNFSILCGQWKKCGSWQDFFENLAWAQEAEMIATKAQTVKIITMHAAKGLEFHSVFIPGLEYGLMPLDRGILYNMPEKTDVQSEKRLLYVAITRASSAIYASYCQKRHFHGRELALEPSPFIKAIEKYCDKSHMRMIKKIDASLGNFFSNDPMAGKNRN